MGSAPSNHSPIPARAHPSALGTVPPRGLARGLGAWLTALLAAPAVGVAWLVRSKWRPGLGERLGRVPAGETAGAIWVHAASVGEASAALRLIDELRTRGHAVRASTWTVTGRALLSGARPDVPASLAPLDHPFAVDAALSRAQPSALVLVETELWPSWVAAAHRRGLPVIVVSGRISDRSLPRYERLHRWIGPTLRRLTAVAARSEEDARRFAALGVAADRISVTGDLKLEGGAPPRLAPELDEQLGRVPCLVAGSTHEGEESGAFAAFGKVCASGLEAFLVLAPRHPERFERVARWLTEAGATWQRRSEPAARPMASGEVLLLDSVGELAGVYARAQAAFVGGSWARDVGGHNVLEPVFAGRPVSFGPHTPNARAAVGIVLESGAAEVVAGPAELAKAWCRDLANPADADARGAAGRRALLPHEGAARRAADRIEEALSASESPGEPR